MSDPGAPSTAQGFLRDYFSFLDDAFRRLTGESYSEYATVGEFDATVREKASRAATHFGPNYPKVLEELRAHYARHKLEPFRQARELPGLKYVIGGSGRFTPTHLGSVRKMLLYADTVLVPDPVLPWIETPRHEEKFHLIWFLKALHTLLQLKPLVDADLPGAAVFVFPSWEKSLEDRDPVTKEGISDLSLSVLNMLLNKSFAALGDVAKFARDQKQAFLLAIDEAHAFVGPGGEVGEALSAALGRYRLEVGQWRSEDFNALFGRLSEAEQIIVGLQERIAPQFHLLENSHDLDANPLIALPNHWHYYQLVAKSLETRLIGLGVLSPSSVKIMHGLNQPGLNWLGNVPIEALVRLRQEGENEAFRNHLNCFINALGESPIQDLERTSQEVTRGIRCLVEKHQKEMAAVLDRYKHKHGVTAVGAWVSLAGVFLPALAPWFGTTAPLALLIKYTSDKSEERKEMKARSASLMGVLAQAEGGA